MVDFVKETPKKKLLPPEDKSEGTQINQKNIVIDDKTEDDKNDDDDDKPKKQIKY